jgi:hypothetical protein
MVESRKVRQTCMALVRRTQLVRRLTHLHVLNLRRSNRRRTSAGVD